MEENYDENHLNMRNSLLFKIEKILQLLVYEQDEVQLLTNCEEEAIHIGKLRIVEKGGAPVIEWLPTLDDSSDGEWAVISSPNVTFSNKKMTDSVTIGTGKKNISVYINVQDNLRCKVVDDRRLEILNSGGDALGVFLFHNEHIEFFFDVIRRYFTMRQDDEDSTLFVLQNKHQADMDDKLSALNLVPQKTSPPRRSPKHYPHNSHHHWASEAPKKVWGFIHNMKKDPYTTTLSTLSKVYDVVLYGDIHEHMTAKEEGEDVRELLQRISGMDDLEPGYEILTKREQLADRPDIERLPPLGHEEYKSFMDAEGRITQVKSLRERIFRGGIHPNLRLELWCYLLDFYDWTSTRSERETRKRSKEHEYFVMKQQWKTISAEQERNFSGFRDRKSIIEKDVNRTDRNHPFYEGEMNTNLEMLNDILMTYIMYNFDLGYVQGMSDLLAPILYVVQSEAMAFWCFVGYMNRVYRNFDLDQSGMKQQLGDLSQLLRIVDPEFVSFLEAQDSANLYFCFRWLLVRFKRELNYTDTLRLWEVLWTDHLCPNFHLCVATALLDTERDEIVEKKFGFTDVLKHINGLSLRIDLDAILKKSEAIYVQLSNSPSVPNSVRTILNLPHVQKTKSSSRASPMSECSKGLPGHVERVTSPEDGHSSTWSSKVSNKNSEDTEELCFEAALSQSFI